MEGKPARHLYSAFKVLYKKSGQLRFLQNSRGFNLIELMIVVAIVGIIAAVSIPLYMGYIQKSRVKSLVYPGLHVIESNIGVYYAINGVLPGPAYLPNLWADADTTYLNVNIYGNSLVITIDSPDPASKLNRLDGMELVLIPNASNFKISSWELSGDLAIQLGIRTY